MDSTLIGRNVEPWARQLLSTFPVVVIEGARQVGKSTLAGMLLNHDTDRLVTLDDEALLDAATQDPLTLLDRAPQGCLAIDEIQLRPELTRTIKARVDRDRRPGQFLLTGSADLLRLRDMGDSLAGRAVTLTLRGLSVGEAHGRRDDFATAVASGALTAEYQSAWMRSDYADTLARGGFPEAQRLSGRLRSAWLDGWLARVLERDAPLFPGGNRAERLRSLATLVAADQAGELVKARMADAAEIPAASITSYLDALQSVFVLERIRPWSRNLTRRETGRSKAFISDSAVALRLNRQTPDRLAALEHAGALGGPLEAFVMGELLKQQSWSTTDYELYHWRDRNGLEVDGILELEDGRVIALEVKASGTWRGDQFRHLTALRDALGDRFVAGVVLGTATHAHHHADRLWGLPISALWELLPNS